MGWVNRDMKDFEAVGFFSRSSCHSISSCKTSTKLSHPTWQENRARTRRYNMIDWIYEKMECLFSFWGQSARFFTSRLCIKPHKSRSETLNDQHKGEMIGLECLVFFFRARVGHAQLKLKPVGGWIRVGRLSNRWFKVQNSVTDVNCKEFLIFSYVWWIK